MSEPTLKEACDIITELLEWKQLLGGGVAECWKKARAFRNAAVPRQPYLVRRNCEYSVVVDAMDLDDAVIAAQEIPLSLWDTAWSLDEAEEAG
jgi:hypothetical protein